ncbi:hypothetical protein Cgig2_014117 [Carnegiea gigantea]|uniref:Uncharacterized protein n=1 Tax=Carnegiea gigantea TaxID=171969 RepID=A0A9Q1KYE4_9CARY|nr:hypothetical protein Cgig2_014117 [Carnegiea gigantea]
MAFPPLYNTKEMADYVRESFIWPWRRATCPPRPFAKDYHVLCPNFLLPEAEGATADFELPEMVQATSYAMLLNEAVELGVVHGFMAEGLKLALVRILNYWSHVVRSEWPAAPSGVAPSWTSVSCLYKRRHPSTPGPRLLPSDYHDLCPHFDLGVATRYARGSNTPEMMQKIFYVMVIDNAAKLGLSRRLNMDCVMWVMRKLDWGPVEAWLGDTARRLQRAQTSRPTDPPINPVLAGGPSRRRTTSFPSFRDTVQAAEYVRGNLCWSVRETSSLYPNLLPLHFTAYCPEFDHIVAMQFAHAAHIPEMVQAIFYAMVINDATKLRLIRRETRESLMLDLRKMRWDIIEVWMLSIEDKLKDAQVSSPSGDGRPQPSARGPSLRITSSEFRPWGDYAVRLVLQHPRDGTGNLLHHGRERGCGAGYHMQNLGEVPDVGPVVAALGSLRVLVQERQYRLRRACVLRLVNRSADLASSSSPVRRMTKTKSPTRIRSPAELLAEGTHGNPCSAPSSSKPGAEVASTSSSSTSGRPAPPLLTARRYGLRLRASRYLREKVFACRTGSRDCCGGTRLSKGPNRPDPQDGSGSHFSDPKVVPTLKRTPLEKQYLLPAGYTFAIPKADATVNESPAKCIAVYHMALN